MKNFILPASLFIPIILLGIGMYIAARWSRIKNEELKARQEDSQGDALRKMLNGDITKDSVANYFVSSVSKPESLAGKALAIAVILFFVILAVLAAYFVWVRI